MQTPQGFRVGQDGLLYPTNWLQVIFNPSFPYRFVHMITAAYLTTAFTVAGIGAFYLWRQRHVRHARVMLGMAMIMAIFVAPMQLVFGDLHGLNTLEHQPAKVAAMESLWETRRGARTPAGGSGFLDLSHHGGDRHVDDRNRCDGHCALFEEALVR